MNSGSAVPSTSATSGASATLYLVSRTVDRLDEARRRAAALIATTPSETQASLVLRGAHPDVVELVPLEKKERIGIDQVREVVRLAQFSPVQAMRKVCVIPRAEALTPEAANALLRILEEPPRDIAFVLLAEHPHDLLPTIVSRCRAVRIPPPERDALRRRLVDAGAPPDEADGLARFVLRDGDLERLLDRAGTAGRIGHRGREALAESSVSEAIDAALGDEPIERYQALLQLLDAVGRGDHHLLTAGVRLLAGQDRETLVRFLQELLAVAFAVLRGSPDGTAAPSEAELRSRIGEQRLLTLCNALDDTYRSICTYTPPEAALLAALWLPEGATHGA